MDMQNVKNLEIIEGEVKTIHDKDSKLLWGAVGYDTKYAGDTYQQTYSGKNLWNNAQVESVSDYVLPTATGLRLYKTANGRITPQYSISLSANTTYTISCVSTHTTQNSLLLCQWKTEDNTTLWSPNIDNGTTAFTPNKNIVGVVFYLQNTETDGTYVEVNNLMIESGSTATSYEPYVGGTASPNPDYPQDIQVVTGEQVVSIADGTNVQNFTVDLGSIELAKIDTYQDYIYKSGDDWYVHKETGKVVIDGGKAFTKGNDLGNNSYYYCSGYDSEIKAINNESTGFSDMFRVASRDHVDEGMNFIYLNESWAHLRIFIDKTIMSGSASDFVNWLSTHNVTLYHLIPTPTDTKITDATLISELEAIHEWITRYGYTPTVSGNLPLVINQTNLT